MRSNYKRIGDYIALVDERNVDLKVTTLLGLSISKQFIPSVANIIGTNMKNYKIIRKNQFACSVMQVRRDGKMPVALLRDFEEAIISQAYPVFEVVDTSLLLPEYLMMWFTRSEFDRQATFHAVGGVRGSLEWEDFMDFELPVPSIEIQQEIVNEYHTITKRIELNEKLNQKLEETAQALYKHWFVDFEFPNENGEPYKSSGGAMVYNEELDGEIPEGWVLMELSELVSTQYGYTERATEEEVGPKFLRITDIAQTHISWNNVPFCPITDSDFSKYELKRGDIVIARTGATVGYAKQMGRKIPKAVFASYLVRIIPNDPIHQFLLGMNIVSKEYREFVLSNAEGSAQPQANARLMTTFSVIVPDNFVVKEFNELIISFYDLKEINELQDQYLFQLQELLLSKMATVGSEEILNIN